MITKQQIDIANSDFEAGEVLLIDKKFGLTSFSAIYKVKKILNIRKAGHAGTLDPYATGLLIICTGKKTKDIYKYQDLEKTYSGNICLGKITPSMDAETEVIEEHSIDHITEDDILKVRDSFLGTISQMPPMYSAIKFKGKALYKYARKGVEIEREPRQVEISRFEITGIDLPDIHFEIKCSKGTYVRVIAGDFGDKLGCGAYLKSLRRSGIGEYSVNDAFTIDELKSLVNNKTMLQ
ncbi:MAG: tRNA pseudouridine(55) synthase TruB [bacterium]